MRSLSFICRGFSLLEIAVVLVIIGSVLGAGTTLSMRYFDQKVRGETDRKLEYLERMLNDYYIAKGHLPCPADITLADTSPTAGTGTGSGSTTGTCSAANYRGGTSVAGGVPYRTLAMPPEFGYDSYGRRILYAVDQRKTIPNADYTAEGGDLRILDRNGHRKSAGADYVLVSYGADGHGGYSRTGARVGNASTNPATLENCDCTGVAQPADVAFDGVFVSDIPAGRKSDLAAYFDDLVRYRSMGTLNDLPTSTQDVLQNCSPTTLQGGGTMRSGEYRVSYPQASATFPALCDVGNLLLCTNTTLSCSTGNMADCAYSQCGYTSAGACSLPWGGFLPSGGEVTAYQNASASPPSQCVSQIRACAAGTLSGTYQHQYCLLAPSLDCFAPWGTAVLNGNNVTAWLEASAPSCTSETRTCTTGSLSGSYQYETCTVSGGGGGTPFRIDGAVANNESSFSLASGDINGDGMDDIIIGARNASPSGRSGAGSTYVIFGKASGWSGIDLNSSTSYDGTNGIRIDGAVAGDGSGSDVTTGDVNGDGFKDIIIGSPYATPSGPATTWAGSTYVIFGKASGWSGTPIDLNSSSSYDGTNGIRIDGGISTGFSGTSVAAGDVNGDGRADIMIGAFQEDPGSLLDAGSTYVIFGKASGWSGTPIDLNSSSSYNGTNGIRIDGAAAGDFLGLGLAAGDLNGDGNADILVSARDADPSGRSGAGSTYVIFGKGSGWSGTPIDLSSASSYNGTNGIRLDGAAASDYTGATLSAGNINGDGYQDLILPAFIASPSGRSSAGSTYVIFGKASGWSGTPVDLNSASSYDGTNGIRVDGAAASDQLGYNAEAGDLNGDGFQDLIIPAYNASPSGRSSAGSTYVIFGKASGWSGTPIDLNYASSYDGTTGIRLDGAAANDSSGYSVTAGDVNGDGNKDILIGAYNADPSGRSSAGSTWITFGQTSGWSGTPIDLSTY